MSRELWAPDGSSRRRRLVLRPATAVNQGEDASGPERPAEEARHEWDGRTWRRGDCEDRPRAVPAPSVRLACHRINPVILNQRTRGAVGVGSRSREVRGSRPQRGQANHDACEHDQGQPAEMWHQSHGRHDRPPVGCRSDVSSRIDTWDRTRSPLGNVTARVCQDSSRDLALSWLRARR